MKSRYPRPSQFFAVLIASVAVLVGISAVFADLVQPDGRINQVHHFGGDALYCVDRNLNPTDQYDDFGGGGLRLLDKDGQELWFIPSSTVDVAAAESQANQQTVLVDRGQGTYGPTELYARVTEDNDVFFTFFGYDEHGKQNRIDFKFCIPVGPIGQPTDEPADEPEVTEEPLCISLLRPQQQLPDPIPCSECPDGLYYNHPILGLVCGIELRPV